jgi:hypothetical protein
MRINSGMKFCHTFLFILLLFSMNPGFSQYQGGNGDGYFVLSSGFTTMNPQPGYCSGGSGDGFHETLSSVITPNSQLVYCNGGSGDGSESETSIVMSANSQSLYCSGGNADGYASLSMTGFPFPPVLFCNGGNGDGCDHIISGVIELNTQTSYCSGGNGDGYHQITSTVLSLNPQNVYCTGGSADGNAALVYAGFIATPSQFCSGGIADGYVSSVFAGQLLNQSFYCSGGTGDGFHSLVSAVSALGTGLWRGTISSDWAVAGNWTNSIVPDQTVNVIIPGGCPHYPSLTNSLSINNATGTYKAKSILISDGASLVSSGSLSAYGLISVAGSMVVYNNGSETQLLNSGGTLQIEPSGIVTLGNQTSGTGYCDLVVNSGGTLDVEGGFLDVDDQINIMSGGSFNMTGGNVFAHRFGSGSAFSSLYPGSFYVASGASGNISGGVIKVAGKATSGSYVSVGINSAAFDFTNNATLEFTDGVNPNSDDVELRTVTGGNFQNLLIDRPLRTVTIGSNATVNGDITIHPDCTLKVKPGMNVIVEGNVLIME